MRWNIGNVVFDETTRSLRRFEQQIYLEPKIFQLLLSLVQATHHVLHREQLIVSVWQGRVVSESAIHRAISLLRKAFAQLDESQEYIETLARVGYRLSVA